MPSAGPNSPGTVVSDATPGGTAWADPGNAAASDNTYATCGSFSNTQYLKATNFGFAVPGGATIDGVVVEVELAKTSTEDCFDFTARLVKGGAVAGSNYATLAPTANIDTYRTYGGAADLWGLSLTAADVNAADFGFVFRLNNGGKGSPSARVDHVRVTVYYTGGAAAGQPAVARGSAVPGVRLGGQSFGRGW
jgi:hypothetical protein